MISVFLHFFNLSVMAGWMVLAVLLLRLCLKKAPRWITCVLWGLVALRLLVPFTVESPISLIPTAETVVSGDSADTSVPVVNSGVASIDKPLNDWLQMPVEPSTVPSDTDAPVAPIDPNPSDETPDTATPVSRMERVLNVAVPVWLVGIGLMLAYELVSVLRVRRRVLDAVLLRDNVWQSDRVSSPFIFGLFRPRIYVPYHLEESVLEQVLSHERAHLQRRDHWIKPFAFTLLAVYWYNPLLWLGYVLLCRDIEVACDQRVVRGLDEDNRRQYATALLQCGVERRSIAACPLAFGEVSIKQRIKSVLNYRKPLLWVIIASLLACSVAAVCLLTVPGSKSPVVLSSTAVTPDQARQFFSQDTDGSLVEAGRNWMWGHAENPEQQTPDIEYWEETNIPLVVSRSKADLDVLMDACSDETLQVDMHGSFDLEKYNDTYFEDKVLVWLHVPGYSLGHYDYAVTLEETTKGLRYAVSLEYESTSMFDPWTDNCEYLLLFETDRKAIEEAKSLTTRHERAPIQVPTAEDDMVTHAVGNADFDGDGVAESVRVFHSPDTTDGAFMVVCKADGTPILREKINHHNYSQCYLVPQDDGSSLLLFVETDGVGEGDREEFGVLSLQDGERTVVQYRHDGRIYPTNLELGEVISYTSSLSDWMGKAHLLFELENGSLYYGDTLGDTPRYTPLCWLDTYRTNADDTVQDILENVITSLNSTVTPIGNMDFDEDGQADSLFVLSYMSHLDMFEACLLVRAADDTILTTIPIYTYYNSIDKTTYLYRATDHAGKDRLQEVTLFMDGTCHVSDLSMEGASNYRSMAMTEWLGEASKTGADLICYLEGRKLYFPDADSTTQTDKINLPDYFLTVLQNRQTFVMDKEFFNGEAITLSRLLKKYDTLIGRYTLVDMDEDDLPELVVQFRSLNYNLVIKKDGNHYYGYLFGIREMQSIHTDGTFDWAGGAGYTGCSRIRFNGDTYETVELWHMDEDASHGNYYVDGKAVTKDEYLAATANAAPEVAWAEWDESLSGSGTTTTITSKTDGTTMTAAELLALCKSKIQSAQEIEGWYMGGSHYTTTIPAGTVTTLLNGETYVLKYEYYPLTDDTGAEPNSEVITAAALKQQIESVYTSAFAHERYYDDGYAWVVYNGEVYHVTADGVISEVVDADSVTDIRAEKDTITFRVKAYGHGDGEEVEREMKLLYVEGNWKFDELV